MNNFNVIHMAPHSETVKTLFFSENAVADIIKHLLQIKTIYSKPTVLHLKEQCHDIM